MSNEVGPEPAAETPEPVEPPASPVDGVTPEGIIVEGEIYPPAPYAAALLIDDPPKIGDYWLDARLAARSSGVTYLAHGPDEAPVMLIVLSEGAAGDAAARDRLAGEVNRMHADTVLARGGQGQNDGRLAHKFRSEDDDPVGTEERLMAPWVALAYDGTQNAVFEADRIMRSIDLSTTPTLGSPAGPDYSLPWIEKGHPGGWRLWPLPWPARKDRAGWMTMLVSFLLMLVLTALALLIVVLIFQNAPSTSAPPPVSSSPQSGSPPPSQSPSDSSASPSEQSGSPSESDSASASPSEQSASPSESSGSASQSASPSESSGSPSDSASPTPSDGHGSPSKDPSMMSSGPSPTSGQGTVNPKL